MAKLAIEKSGWERAMNAGEKVKERLRRATRALDAANVPYAVVGGNAVAEWVGRVDEDAVRTTRDVDLLAQRSDLGSIQSALGAVGFIHHYVMGIDTFVDGPSGKPSGGIHILFAGEKVRPEDEEPLPGLGESERAGEFQVAALEPLVRMKLSAWRDKDRTHLRDMISVGLIDATWPDRLSPALGRRLRELLANPDG